MKKLIAIILSALSLLIVFAFTSCDQASVDTMRENFVNTGKEIFGPFFKISDSHKDNNNENKNPDDVEQPPVSSTLNSYETKASASSLVSQNHNGAVSDTDIPAITPDIKMGNGAVSDSEN